MVHELESCIILCADSLEPALDSVSPSLSVPPPLKLCLSLSLSLSLSQKQININKKIFKVTGQMILDAIKISTGQLSEMPLGETLFYISQS